MNPEFKKNIVDKVEGFLMDGEASLLYRLASDVSAQGVILEIGSWKGKSTVIFGTASKAGRKDKIYAVDPHTGSPEHGKVWTFPEFEKNIKMAGVEELVVPIVKTSEEASKGWKEPIRLLWIDGNHDYEFARTDFVLWEPHLAEGGTVAFHDSVWAEGVRRVLVEYLFFSGRFKIIRHVDNIVYAKKTSGLSPLGRLMNLKSYCFWRFHVWNSMRAWSLRKLSGMGGGK